MFVWLCTSTNLVKDFSLSWEFFLFTLLAPLQNTSISLIVRCLVSSIMVEVSVSMSDPGLTNPVSPKSSLRLCFKLFAESWAWLWPTIMILFSLLLRFIRELMGPILCVHIDFCTILLVVNFSMSTGFLMRCRPVHCLTLPLAETSPLITTGITHSSLVGTGVGGKYQFIVLINWSAIIVCHVFLS